MSRRFAFQLLDLFSVKVSLTCSMESYKGLDRRFPCSTVVNLLYVRKWATALHAWHVLVRNKKTVQNPEAHVQIKHKYIKQMLLAL
ncbi:hypothetical protein FB446DRAFT_438791 [Lentinula raphanica]|nr:hypothetical protein FB446DRAFT_438791 [Lentinula raphanica]